MLGVQATHATAHCSLRQHYFRRGVTHSAAPEGISGRYGHFCAVSLYRPLHREGVCFFFFASVLHSAAVMEALLP